MWPGLAWRASLLLVSQGDVQGKSRGINLKVLSLPGRKDLAFVGAAALADIMQVGQGATTDLA